MSFVEIGTKRFPVAPYSTFRIAGWEVDGANVVQQGEFTSLSWQAERVIAHIADSRRWNSIPQRTLRRLPLPLRRLTRSWRAPMPAPNMDGYVAHNVVRGGTITLTGVQGTRVVHNRHSPA